VELCINVDDVDATLSELGAPLVMPPIDQLWGERAAYVEDPDGNLIMLVAPHRLKHPLSAGRGGLQRDLYAFAHIC